MNQTVGQTVGMIAGMAKAVSDIKKAVGANEPQLEEYEEEDPSPPHPHQHHQMMPGSYAPPPGAQEETPFNTMPLGQGPDAPIYAYNKDGSPNITGMLLGNLPKAGPWLRGLTDGVASVVRTMQQQQHPSMGMGHVPQALPQHQPEPQMQHQPMPQPMHQPVQHRPFVPPPFDPPAQASPFIPEPVQQQQPMSPLRPGPRPAPATSFVPSMDAVRQAVGGTQ